ncbi:MAG: hypothetical protein IT381_01565 [Deltaproteobacteria bacterium]|nr:hypothetical protein [Deltaproteobacteria bacterium]
MISRALILPFLLAACSEVPALVPPPAVAPSPDIAGLTFAIAPVSGRYDNGSCMGSIDGSPNGFFGRIAVATLTQELTAVGWKEAAEKKAAVRVALNYFFKGGCGFDALDVDLDVAMTSQDGDPLTRLSRHWEDLPGFGSNEEVPKHTLQILMREAQLATKSELVALAQGKAPQETPPKQAAALTSGSVLEIRVRAKILVLPLKARAGVSADAVQLATNLLLSQLDGVRGLTTVGQDDLQAMLDVDRKKQVLGCDNTSCLAEIGGALGTDLVLYGDVGKVGKTTNINISVIRSKGAAVAARASRLIENEDALLSQVQALVPELVDKLNR